MSKSLHNEVPPPRFALRRDEAAASLSISPTTFDKWIAEGKMPRGVKIDGIRLWNVDRIRSAFLELEAAQGTADDDNPFDGVTA